MNRVERGLRRVISGFEPADGSRRPEPSAGPLLLRSRRPVTLRTIFLSDVHLGFRGCQAELLIDFLRHHEADRYYLVGDIVDGWRLESRWFWPPQHEMIIEHLLREARRGAEVIYLPGNHDEFGRRYLGRVFAGVRVTDRAMHVTADGRRFLVLHGDQFDVVSRKAPWLARLGARLYSGALVVNAVFNQARRALGLDYWSISAWAKLKVKEAVNLIGAFEQSLGAAARQSGADGVICGHIHHAAMRPIDGGLYINIGDFVESCTALTEAHDGRLTLVTWQRFGRGATETLADESAAPAGVRA